MAGAVSGIVIYGAPAIIMAIVMVMVMVTAMVMVILGGLI
jgi:hypothetical protein